MLAWMPGRNAALGVASAITPALSLFAGMDARPDFIENWPDSNREE